MLRFLAASSLLFFLLSVTTQHAFAATGHNCAPPIPPPVSGTLLQPPAIHGLVFINEVLEAPHSTWNCSELGTYTPVTDTWVEIYNSQNSPFDLYGVHTSLDSGPKTQPFYFPVGSAIPPNGYLVIFPRTSSYFSSTETTTLRLLINNIPVDQVTIPSLGLDQSYARIPDGSSTWQICSSPTIDASNRILQATATPTHNPTRTSTSTTRQQGGGTYGNTTTGGSNSTQPVDGVQPTWSTLSLPTTESVATTSTLPLSTTSPTTQTNDSTDLYRKAGLTLLLLALAGALFWCWRLFKPS